MAKKRIATNRYYPLSGILVGELARCLRVSERPGEDALAKRRSRWFVASMEVAPEARSELLSGLIDDVFAEAVVGQGESSDVLEALRLGAVDFIDLYDRVAARLGGHSPVPADHRFSLFPFLRLAVLEIGVRAAAFAGLVRSEPDAPSALDWSQRPALRAVMDRYREKDVSLDEVAQRLGVSATTLDEWRSGRVLPQRDHLELLAEEFASTSTTSEAAIRFDLRFAAARDALYERASPLLGGPVIGPSALAHFFDVAQRLVRLFLPGMRKLLAASPAPRRAVLAIIEQGWRAEIPRGALAPIVAALAEQRHDGELIGDLQHLVHDAWIAERALYWTKYSSVGGATAEAAAELLASYGGKPELLLERWDEVLPEVVAGSFRFFTFDTEPQQYAYSLPIPRPMEAMLRSGPWNAAMSRGDYSGAADLARRSVAEVPKVAIHHFERGAALGQLVRLGSLHLLDEAIAECRLAFALDPHHLLARNEVAVILSNAKLYSDALAEYARAATDCDKLAIFHSGRGWTFLALKSFAEAADAYRASLAIEPENVEAMARLAALELELGRVVEGKRLAREVRHRTGKQLDPERERERLLRVE